MKRKALSLFVVLLLLALLSPQPASAEVASLVADLNVGIGANASSNPSGFVTVGDRVVFFARDRSLDLLPWATDGTAAGTQGLSLEGTFQQGIGMIGGAYLWFGGSSYNGYGLWRTQGTPATTYALVADGIHQPGFIGYEDPIPYAVADGKLYVFADSLWVTDGTRRGTSALAPLATSGTVAEVAYHRGRVFFTTAHFHQYEAVGWELWVSDGTAGGTRLLLSDHGGGFCSTGGGMLFFSDGRLWRSDGTPGGTHPLLPELEPDLVVRGQLCTSAGKLYFTADTSDQDNVLWVSDGTEARTRALHRVDSDSPLLLLGGRIFFVATDQEHGRELWSTRGTSRTTALVADIFPGPSGAFRDEYLQLTAAGGRVFFFAEDHVHGREVWVTDGTKEGTRLTRDVCRGHCSAAEPKPYELTAVEGRVFFLANDGVHGRELWVTDGTREGSRLTRDVCPGGCDSNASDLRALGKEAFYYARDPLHGVELWASNGLPEGTRRLSDFSVAEPPLLYGFYLPPDLARLGHRIITKGYDPRSGFEPWVFDRLGRGGQLLGDLLTDGAEPGSDPRDVAALGDRALFVAFDGSSEAVWATQGSRETTVKLGVVSTPALPFLPPRIDVLGNSAYLNLGDLWRTDGTPSGTKRLTDFASSGRSVSTSVVALADEAVFGVTGSAQETELWVSDGTAAGTHGVGITLPLRVFDLTAIGDDIYFWGNDGQSGWEIWTADSSLSGIRRLTQREDTEPGPLHEPPRFTRLGSHVYFFLSEGAGGKSLWRTDGTPEGTTRVPMPVVDEFEERPSTFISFQGSLLLATDSSHGVRARLWSSDGTTQGTVLLKVFGSFSFVNQLLEHRGEIFVSVWSLEPLPVQAFYRTDGTAGGTHLVASFSLLAVNDLTSAGQYLVFSGSDRYSSGDSELFLFSDVPGTSRRHDINPWLEGSSPKQLFFTGTRLYFSADDGLHGRELWSLPLDEINAPCRPSPTALCLLDGRFRAELFWHDSAGRRGDGYALPWSSESGAFWFYDYGNPEAVVKMIDGAGVNDAFWLFYGALTDAYAALTVTDVTNGRARRYPRVLGPSTAFADIEAIRRSARAAEPCVASATRLCLQGGRFGVELSWRDAQGAAHPAQAYAHSDTAGYFAFFGPHWVEAAVKLLDGRAVNGHSWLFATGLTSLETTLTITDTAAGEVRTSTNAQGKPWSLIDLTSLP